MAGASDSSLRSYAPRRGRYCTVRDRSCFNRLARSRNAFDRPHHVRRTNTNQCGRHDGPSACNASEPRSIAKHWHDVGSLLFNSARLEARVANPTTATDKDALRRFAREVRAMERVSHPNVVPVLDSDLDHAPPYFVMPVAKGSLDQEIPAISKNHEAALALSVATTRKLASRASHVAKVRLVVLTQRLITEVDRHRYPLVGVRVVAGVPEPLRGQVASGVEPPCVLV